MPYTSGHSPNRQSALELVTGSFEDLESAFYDTLYPEFLWRSVMPEASIDTAINPGATTASYRSRDRRGKGSFRAQHDQGIPTVGQTIEKILVPVEVAGVAGIFDREDARQIQFGYSENLITELGDIMREACERHVEGTIFFGDSSVKGFEAWLDYSLVPSGTVPVGVSTTTPWSTKTSDEIIADINNAIATVWTGSKQIHLPDTVFMPGEQLALLASIRMGGASDKNVLEYVKQNNIYTNQTGNQLNVMPIRYLEGAGAGATDRFVVAEMNPRNFKLPFPLPYDLLDPQERGFDVELYAEYKFGSVHMRYPLSMLYQDGI